MNTFFFLFLSSCPPDSAPPRLCTHVQAVVSLLLHGNNSYLDLVEGAIAAMATRFVEGQDREDRATLAVREYAFVNPPPLQANPNVLGDT